MADDNVLLGRLAPPHAPRDATHVAVKPTLAIVRLYPGQHLETGIVDPFLTEPVEPGQWFYLCIYPGTVTGMRHAWQHRAYPDEPVPTDEPVSAPVERS